MNKIDLDFVIKDKKNGLEIYIINNPNKPKGIRVSKQTRPLILKR